MDILSKAIHDQVSPASVGGSTMQHTVQEGPLNCLSLNHDCSQVVAAGRNVFKILSIHDEGFVETMNLRVGKHLNLNFSVSDVVWNPIDGNVLASAATNGAVATWNLNKPGRNKQDWVYSEHTRTVNRVCFHHSEHNLLMSGSQDNYIKIFDLRKKDAVTTFDGRAESVRDVQFSPVGSNAHTFAAAYENGHIQIWDMRNPNKWEKDLQAHNGPVFAIDWHPKENWIASAGRDKHIKVWNLRNPSKIEEGPVIQTIAPVARIKWRPNRPNHIASCALLIDFSINIWDIRRPYVPFAAFDDHKDVVTGIIWKHKDPHIFFSSSKDCSIFQHMFHDAKRPADNANPLGVDISKGGDLASAMTDKMCQPAGKGQSYTKTKLPAFFKRPNDKSEEFTKATESKLSEYRHFSQELSMNWFEVSAKRYKLTGPSMEDLCDMNAKVADDLERFQIAQSWRILKLFYLASPDVAITQNQSNSNVHQEKHLDIDTDKETLNGLENKFSEKAKENNGLEPSTGVSEEESDVQDFELVDTSAHLTSLNTGLHSNNHSDFFFGDGDVSQVNFDYETLASVQNAQDWSLPSEAIQLRHEIAERGNSPDPLAQQTGLDSPSSANETDLCATQSHLRDMSLETNIKEELFVIPTFTSQVPMWDFTATVCDILHYYAEIGDVQMAVTALIILGNSIRCHIDELTQEQWFMSYIELLGRFKLYCVATEVIKRSGVPAVMMLNQQSTTIRTTCSSCNRPLGMGRWSCEHCLVLTNKCEICHLPVRGLYVWCQGCSHGGHLHHMKEWFQEKRHCPTGCGHQCEYIHDHVNST